MARGKPLKCCEEMEEMKKKAAQARSECGEY